MIDERNFIEALKRKDPRALNYVIDKYSNMIYKVSYAVLKSRQLSEECLNDVLLKIWDNIQYFNKDNDKFYIWIIAVAKYTAIDILRKEVRHSNTVEISQLELGDNSSICREFEGKEKLEEVNYEVNKMSDIDKSIFKNKFYFNKTNKEISRELGISKGLVNLRVFRVRKKLKEKFEIKEDII